MNTDEQLITESLNRLATYAPTFTPAADRPETRRGKVLAPLLAAAAVLVLVGVGVALTGDSETAPDTDPVTTPTLPEHDGTTLMLGDAGSLPTEREATCATWNPPPVDTIIRVDSLTDDCITKARLDVTTVVFAPYDPAGLFGESWEETTTPWRTVGESAVRRLTSGPLAEMSSRVVDGLVCAECDQVILVLGPDPARVRGLVESVREGSQFPPDPVEILDCGPDGMTIRSLGWVGQNAPTPRGAAERLLGEPLPGAEIVTWRDRPYLVIVPDASGGIRAVVVTLRNEKGRWDADEIYDCGTVFLPDPT